MLSLKRLGRILVCCVMCIATVLLMVYPTSALTYSGNALLSDMIPEAPAVSEENLTVKSVGHTVSKVYRSASYSATVIGCMEDGTQLKVLGTKGCLQSTINDYKLKYIVDGENPEQPVQPDFLRDEEGLPMYCKEQLKFHKEEGSVTGTAFAAATASFYEMMYDSLVNGAELKVKPENIAKLVNVMEIVHAQNPLPVTYLGGKHV